MRDIVKSNELASGPKIILPPKMNFCKIDLNFWKRKEREGRRLK